MPSPILSPERIFCEGRLAVLTGQMTAQVDGRIHIIKDRSVSERDNQHDIALRYIEQEIERMGLEPERQMWIQKSPENMPRMPEKVFTNLSVTLPGFHPRNFRQTVLVGAHYDVVNGSFSTWKGDRSVYQASPGADDNGSGVVALLEILRRLKDQRFPHDIQIVFFDGEEHGPYGGLVGSQHFVSKLSLGEKSKIRMMIALDMLGVDSGINDFRYTVAYGNMTASILKRFLFNDQSVLRRAFQRRPVYPLLQDATAFHIGVLGLSDSRIFYQSGIPSVLMTNARNASRPPIHYHTEIDTPDRFRWDRFFTIVDDAESMVRALAEF